MTNAFITNADEKKLANRIKDLCESSDRFDMLVGYFHFSAIGSIADAMFADPNRKMRVLVGLEAEHGTSDAIGLGVAEAAGGSNEERRAAFYRSVETSLRNPALDRKAFFERLGLVIDWIRNGRLEIRKTLRPNHSKLYIFQMDRTHRKVLDRVFITGSSNFSEPGLRMQDEFNVEIKDYGTDEAQRYFDDLWKEALPLTKDDEQRGVLIDILTDASSLVTPFEAYLRVLKAYIGYQEAVLNTRKVESLLKRAGFNKYQYQVDAVAQAVRKLDDYGGVIVADVVGLGKSIIGGLIGALREKRGMVICPPGLVGPENGEGGGWNGYLKSFGLDEIGWKAMSRGDLGNIQEAMKGANYEIVVVDEAHAYRTRTSRGYEDLHDICAGREVVLLTATPFNNRPNDLLALLLLFSEAKDSPFVKSGMIEDEFMKMDADFKNLGRLKRLVKTGDLQEIAVQAEKCGITAASAGGGTSKAGYAEAANQQMKVLTARLRAVMEQIVIRRNRIDIEKTPHYKAEIGDMSKVRSPLAQHFELTAEQNAFYDRVIKEYFGDENGRKHFHGAIYRPDHYQEGVKDEYQENVYKMIRQGLVLRFESSFGAFRQSIANVLKMIEHTREFIEKTEGRIYYNRKIMEKILALDDEDGIDVLLDQLIAEDQARLAASGRNAGKAKAEYNLYSKNFDGAHYMQDLNEDLALLKKIMKEIDALGLATDDPKAEALVKAVKKVLAGRHGDVAVEKGEPVRKVIVFTGYTDTLEHLEKFMSAAFPGKVVAVSGANYGSSLAAKVRAEFDASAKKQTDGAEILLATDKLSEGFNLNRAGLVVNYDIPWNPTRVIQRVGRINRIGRMVFKDLYIFNFFPTVKGATIAQNRTIAEEKMFAIHGILGEDAQMFSSEEEPTAAGLYNKLCSLDDEEELSFYTKVKGEYEKGMAYLRKHDPVVAKRLEKRVMRIKTAFSRVPNGTYMFARRGASLFASFHNPADGTIVDCPLQDAIEGIACSASTASAKLGADFWDGRDPATGKVLKGKGVYAQLEESMRRAPLTASGRKKVTQSVVAAARLEASLGEFDPAEQDFVADLVYDLKQVGSLAPKTVNRLAKPGISFDELRALVQEIAEAYGEDFFREKKTKQRKLEIIATIQRV